MNPTLSETQTNGVPAMRHALVGDEACVVGDEACPLGDQATQWCSSDEACLVGDEACVVGDAPSWGSGMPPWG